MMPPASISAYCANGRRHRAAGSLAITADYRGSSLRILHQKLRRCEKQLAGKAVGTNLRCIVYEHDMNFPESGMATVLVVEDELLIRDLVAEELELAGFTVLLAPDADAAISIMESRQDIRLIFTDVDMPGSMDGLKLAAAVRDRWPPVHIIITTGKVRPLEIPANAMFIPKPYLAGHVIAAMKTFESMSD